MNSTPAGGSGNLKLLLLAASPFLLLCLCASASGSGTPGRCVIIQTSDVHCRIAASKDSPGWLRLASVIRKEVAAAGGPDSCLLVDCGDTLQGSLEGAVSKGEAGAIMLNSLAYDAWIPGNHDLDFGAARMLEIAGLAKADKIAANMTAEGARTGLFMPWKMFTRNKLRIAVVGMTLGRTRAAQGSAGGRMDVAVDGYAPAMGRIVQEIMEAKPDLLVLAVHDGLRRDSSGLSRLEELCRKYPQIDLVLGGHTHEANPGERIGLGTWFAEPPDGAKAAVKAVISFDGHSKRPLIRSELLVPAPDTPEDGPSSRELSEWLRKAADASKEVLGEISVAARPYGESRYNSPAADFVYMALSAGLAAEAAISCVPSQFEVPQGKVTYGDIFSLFPYEDSVCSVELEDGDLAEVVREQLAKIDSGAFYTLAGVRCDISRDGSSVGIVREDGKGGRLRIVSSSYLLGGAEGRFPMMKEICAAPAAGLTDHHVKVRDIMADYVRKHTPVRLECKEWIRKSQR